MEDIVILYRCDVCSLFGCSPSQHNLDKKTMKFISKSRKVHGWQYDYSLAHYVTYSDRVTIICPKHGKFLQKAYRHYTYKRGCFPCRAGMLSTEDFIRKSHVVHGDIYDYSQTVYINNTTAVAINCNIHGLFKQLPSNHLSGKGCQKCGDQKLAKTTEEFIEKAIRKHGDLYDYSKCVYTRNYNKVIIICKIHGEFEQLAHSHVRGSGCPRCGGSAVLTLDIFIERSRQVHGELYDYSHVVYTTIKTHVKIVCPKHGVFLQIPDIHMRGSGCPTCSMSKAEKELAKFCAENSLKSVSQKSFANCRFIRPLRFDRFLPEYNLLIEVHGEQHFHKDCYIAVHGSFNNQQDCDVTKVEYAFINNFSFLALSYKVSKKKFAEIMEDCIDAITHGNRIFRFYCTNGFYLEPGNVLPKPEDCVAEIYNTFTEHLEFCT